MTFSFLFELIEVIQVYLLELFWGLSKRELKVKVCNALLGSGTDFCTFSCYFFSML